MKQEFGDCPTPTSSSQNNGERAKLHRIQETSKQISTRLGAIWKSLTEDERELYTDMSRKFDAEHK
jgi:hypothetical protein